MKRVIIAGGSGFIGHALVKEFSARDCEVFILTRTPYKRADGVREIFWDGEHLDEWAQLFDGADAVINLAGRTVHCIHSPENLRQINESRANSVRAIVAAISQAKQPPRVWVQAGGIGFYGDKGNELCVENSSAGDDSLSKICRQWEAAFNAIPLAKTRCVVLRIGIVLGVDGGGLPVMTKLTKWFLGGAAGNGRQFFSWIHLADLARMFVVVVDDEKLSGVFNAVAPNPLTNAGFMRELRRALHRPWSPPVPEFAVRIGARLMGTESSFVLTSCRCAPKKFLEAGFQFQFSELRDALLNLNQ